MASTMASFARRWSPAAAWSVDDASTFAAQKEFKLLQLLSNDKKALATARRLGVFSQKPQLQGQASAARAGAGASRSSNAGAASTPKGPTAKQKKSAARSARRHASRRAQERWNRCCTAVLCIVKLQRRVRGRVLQKDLADIGTLGEESDAGAPAQLSTLTVMRAPGPKRPGRPESTASSSHLSFASSSDEHGDVYGGGRRAAPQTKQPRVEPLMPALPPGWRAMVDPRSGFPYYVDTLAGITQWEHPGQRDRHGRQW